MHIKISNLPAQVLYYLKYKLKQQGVALLIAAIVILFLVSVPILRSTPVFSAGWFVAFIPVIIFVMGLIIFVVFLFLGRRTKQLNCLCFPLNRLGNWYRPRYGGTNTGSTFIVMLFAHFFFHWVFTRQPNAWPANLRPVFFIPTVFGLIFICSLGAALLWWLLTAKKTVAFLWGGKDKEDPFYTNRLRQYAHGVLIITAALFIFLIAGPVHIAAGGNISLNGQLLLLIALICTGIGLLGATPVFILKEKYKYPEGALTGLLLLCTLNAFIIPFQASILDGGELGTIAGELGPLIRNIIVFVILFLTASKFRKNLRFVAVPLMIFTVVLTVHNWQSTRTSDSIWYARREEIIADAATFSTGRNIVVIVTDMLQGTIADHIFEEYPHFLESFDGFTLFTRAFTSFPFTRFSREMIQTGALYSAGSIGQIISQEENALASFNSSFISDMYQAGACVHGFNISLSDKFPSVHRFNPPIEPLRLYGYALAASVARLTGYWTPNPFGGHALDFVMADSVSSVIAHDVLVERFRVAGDGDKLLYFWDYTLHTPVVFRRDGTIRPEPAEGDDVVALVDEMYFGYSQLVRLFETMKENGVYDNSLIIIVSDHGHGFGARDPLYLGNFAEGANSNGNFLGIFRYNTVLFVKPPYARGPAEISHNPAWSGDVRALINFYHSNFVNISPIEVMTDIRAGNPEVGVLFGSAEMTMPDMWHSTLHHEIVKVSSLYDIPAAFAEQSGIVD